MYYLLTCLHICLCFFPAQTHISGEKALFYSYHVLITEICWMLLLFDVIKLKGKRPVTCDTDSFSLYIAKSRSVWSLVNWIYIFQAPPKKLAWLKLFPYDFALMLGDSRVWEFSDLTLNCLISKPMPTPPSRSLPGKCCSCWFVLCSNEQIYSFEVIGRKKNQKQGNHGLRKIS